MFSTLDKIILINLKKMFNSEETEGLSINVEAAYTVIPLRIAQKEGTRIDPLCFCKNNMCRKGTMKLVCKTGKCPINVDYAAFAFFVKNGYFNFTKDPVDPTKEIAIVDVPLCIRCSSKKGEICLISYLSPKTVEYPAHKGIIWRCSCKQNYRAGLGGELCTGWKKFGPGIDNPRSSGGVSFSVDDSSESFDFASYKA